MRLFRSAVMIVAPHGAGLSNMVFSEPGTVVIEGVCNRPHVNLCFHREAYVLGHHWHGIPSRGGCEEVVDVSATEVENVVRKYLSLMKLWLNFNLTQWIENVRAFNVLFQFLSIIIHQWIICIELESMVEFHNMNYSCTQLSGFYGQFKNKIYEINKKNLLNLTQFWLSPVK